MTKVLYKIVLLAAVAVVSSVHATEQECTLPQGASVDDNNDEMTSQQQQLDKEEEDWGSIVPIPKMPEAIRAVLQRDWKALGGDVMLDSLRSDGVLEFAHGRADFYSHLQGTYSILKIWNQPEAVCRTGMTHTAYSGDLFQFFLWDSVANRDELRSMIGEEAEALTYIFGTINRGQLGGFGATIHNHTVMAPLTEAHYNVSHRETGTTLVSKKDAARIIMVTIADYLDQMVDTNGWRDHHQVEFADRLYPGDGRPAIALNWFSTACMAIRDHLDVVPPVFQHCTERLSIENEIRARDAYWHLTLHEKDLTEEEQEQLLKQSIEWNPYVGEPHMLLSQLYFRNGQFRQAAHQARYALEKFYALASAWDKRRDYAHWVGFARMLMLRSNRLIQGKTHLPYHDPTDPTYQSAGGLYLTSLHDVVAEMKSYEEA